MKRGHLPKSPQVALLTPYDGGNLGDAAIQEALISNLRRCEPGIGFYGITLDPARTAARHGIQCYPLAANSLPHYLATPPTSRVQSSGWSGLYRRLRRLALRVPPFKWSRMLVLEAVHVVRSFTLLRQVDALVVAGGGQLDDEWGGSWGHPYALMKWCLLARAAGSSVIFLSVGACRIESRLTRFFLKIALSQARYRSYRDTESRRLALTLTPQADGPVVPDLAFSFRGDLTEHTGPEGSALRVGFSPIAYGHAGLWPTADRAQYERYLAEIAVFVGDLLRGGASVTLFSSSPPDDQVFSDLYQRIDPGLDSKSCGQLNTSPVETVADLIGVLNSVDLVVASRLHGVLLSFLAGKPAIAISYDRKVTCLMEELGQAAYCVDIRSFESGDLLECFSALQAHRRVIQSAVAARCSQYDQVLQEQYRLVSQFLACPTSIRTQPGVSLDGPYEGRAEIGRSEVSQVTEPRSKTVSGASRTGN